VDVWCEWYNVVESTAMGAEWIFYEICKSAKDIQDMWKKPWSMEYYLLFYPWRLEKWYRSMDNILFTIPEIEYFNDLTSKGIKLDKFQMTWYALKRRVLREDMFREYPSTFEEAFLLISEWSYYEHEINLTRQQKRVCRVPYDPNLLVYTAWDLWGAWWWDDTSIRFFQIYWWEVRIIDYWEWNKMSLIAILDTVIKPKPYKYWKHFWPHDMKVTEYSSGKTRRQSAYDHWFTFEVLDKLAIRDWIDNVRTIFPRCFFDEEKTITWFNHLTRYRRKFNEKYGTFTDEAEKNWSQHAADAFRYMAMAIVMKLLETKETVIVTPDHNY